MYSEVLYRVEFSNLSGHGLTGESSTHFSCLFSAFGVIGSARGVVAALPTDCDGGVVAECWHTYNVKVSMQAA